ncbi:MFS transporter [Nocardiopsis sp. JB363]|uniref:MFS transporter n=1 Tax=Nocardiopsis sp. JB363 TaxID=1434837 RepID=UPI00097AFB55|nr:MFS transporter [Nocardiopsis sp. JB363]SIO85504.1 Multidrug resistance protein B [Nocardiopsis sp. JB363]
MPPTNTRESPWRFSRDERTLVLGALLNSMAFFAALPFAALYLADRTDLPTAGIGAVVGGIPLIAALGGLAGGMLADRFGTVRLMRLGLLSNVLVYVALAFVTAPVAIIALFLCLGVGRTMVEPSMKKLLSLADTGDGRIFRVRYITLCLGAIVGPAVGGLLYHASPTAFFLVPAAFFALYLAVMVVRGGELARLDSPASGGADAAWTAALRDPLLLAAIGAGAVVFLVFSQMDTAIPLYMKGTYGDRTEYLFASLLVVNAVLALLVQPLVIRLSERLPHGPLVTSGCACFAVAFAFVWLGTSNVVALYVAIVFWTLGEAILLPLPDIAVHAIATDDRKGTYFGLSELRYLGFFAGPVLGGVLLDLSAPVYFTGMALAIFLCVPLLSRTAR